MILIFSTLLIFFCGKETEPLQTPEAEVYVNTDKPLKDTWDLTPSLVWSVNKIGEYEVVSISSINEDKEGKLYFLERKHNRIVGLGEDGVTRFVSGRSGEGPGEFKLAQLVFLVGDLLIVADNGQRLHYFSTDGEFIKTIRVKAENFPFAFLNQNSYLTLNSDPDDKSVKDRFEIYDIKRESSSVIKNIVRAKSLDARARSGDGQMRIRILFDDLTPMAIKFFSQNFIYYGRNDEYLIKKIDLSGKELMAFSLEGRKKSRINEKYKDSEMSKLKELPDVIKKQLRDDMPDECTFFEKIFVDENGFIYSFVSNALEKTGHEIDIFSPKGKYIYRTSFYIPGNNTLVRPAVLTKGGNLYALIEDEQGMRRLNKYKVKRPKN